MFLEITDIDSWKNFFDLIHDSTSIVELKLTQEKCGISLLNDSHVCFYMIDFHRNFFENYDIHGVESVLIFVNDFYNIIKTASSKDSLVLISEDNYLKIILEHDTNRRVFEIPLAEDYGDAPSPPSLEYKTNFKVNLNDLKQPCIDLDKIIKTDRFKMILKEGKLAIISPNDSMTKYTQYIDVDNTTNAESNVNLKYILDLQKLKKISNEVFFKMDKDLPLTWNMLSEDGLVEVSGLIAPIIEENDE